MNRKDTNQTVQDSTTVWCGGCGAWFRTSVYRMINGDVDSPIVESFLEKGFAGINHSTCAACNWEYVAEERLGVHYPSRGVLLLVVPDGLRHRAQRLRANFIEDVTQAPGQLVAPYLLEPTLVGGKEELAKMLEVRGVVHDEDDFASIDDSMASLSESSASMSGEFAEPEAPKVQEAVRRRAKSLNLLAELLSDEEDTEDAVAPGLTDGPALEGLTLSSDRSVADVTIDPFLEDEEAAFSVPLSSNVGSRLRVLLGDEIVMEPIQSESGLPSSEFVDTSESSIAEDALGHGTADELGTQAPQHVEPESVDEDFEDSGDEMESLDEASEDSGDEMESLDEASEDSGDEMESLDESMPSLDVDGSSDEMAAGAEVAEIGVPASSPPVDQSTVQNERPVETEDVDDVSASAVSDEPEVDVESQRPLDVPTASAPVDNATAQVAPAFDAHSPGNERADQTHSDSDVGGAWDAADDNDLGNRQDDAIDSLGLNDLVELEAEPVPDEEGLTHGLQCLDGQVVASSIQCQELLDAAAGGDLAIRFQHHRLAEGSALALTLVISGANEFDIRSVVWAIDPSDEGHWTLLEQLAETFEIKVRLGTDADGDVSEWLLAPALADNVSEALGAPRDGFLTEVGSKISQEGYPVLGEMHHNFTEDSFSQLLTAAEARLAVGIVSYWNSPAQREYLIGIQSFSAGWWGQIVRRVLEAAFQFGLVVEGNLRAEMRRVARASGEIELLRVLIAHFAEVNLNLRPNELDPLDLWENWDQLLVWSNSVGFQVDAQVEELASRALADAEKFASDDESADESYAAIEVSLADAIDVASFGPARFRTSSLATVDSGSTMVIEPAMAELTDQELLEALSDAERRAGASVHLVGRGLTEHAVQVFDAVKQMTAPELGVVVPSLLPVSEAFVSLFRSVLYSEDEALRLSAAMLLAEVGDERALNPVLAMMLEPEEERWELLAETAARLGPMVVQPGLSRAAVDETSAYRIAVLLGYVASTNSGTLDGLEEQQEDPAVVACISRARTVAEALGRPETPPFANRLTTVLETLAHASIHG